MEGDCGRQIYLLGTGNKNSPVLAYEVNFLISLGNLIWHLPHLS